MRKTFYPFLLTIVLASQALVLGAEESYPNSGENPQTEKLFAEAVKHMAKEGAGALLWHEPQKGIVVMRGSRTEAATWAAFRVLPERCYPLSGYNKPKDAIFANVGKDLKEDEGIPVSNAGHFAIYHHGPLLIDADIMKKIDQNGRQKERCWCELGNYNIVVVDDEDQLQPGQDGYRPPQLVALENTEHFAYLCADLTGVYRNMESFTRQFVFVRPDLFVVFDRVKTARKSSKAWTLNFIEEPLPVQKDMLVAQSTARSTGQIFCKCLLPTQAVLVKRVESYYGSFGLPRCWRTEWQPRELSVEETFLHVFYVSRTMLMPEEIDLVRLQGRVGAVIIRVVDDLDDTYRVLFNEAGAPGGSIRIETRPPSEGQRRTDVVVDKEFAAKVAP